MTVSVATVRLSRSILGVGVVALVLGTAPALGATTDAAFTFGATFVVTIGLTHSAPQVLE